MNLITLNGCSSYLNGSLIDSSDGSCIIERGSATVNIVEQKKKGTMYPPNMYNRVPMNGPNMRPNPPHISIKLIFYATESGYNMGM